MNDESRQVRSIHDLLEADISWMEDVGNPKWVSHCFGERCELRMNDFPEQPLYTLTWRGQQIDIDDAPQSWLIPHH